MASCGRVVVLGDREGEVKLLHVSFFACVRLFKRTVMHAVRCGGGWWV